MRHQRLDAVEDRVDRAVPLRLLDPGLAVDIELHGGALRPVGAGDNRQRDELDTILRSAAMPSSTRASMSSS